MAKVEYIFCKGVDLISKMSLFIVNTHKPPLNNVPICDDFIASFKGQMTDHCGINITYTMLLSGLHKEHC